MIEEKEDIPNFSISLLKKPAIIDKGIYLCIMNLLKTIFIKSEQKEPYKINKHLNDWITKINKDIIKKKENYIKNEYSLENLKNIILFVKTQNRKYHGDIIESILIYIFSLAFKTDQDNAFCKFIYNNLTKIREHKNPVINWIIKDKIIPDEFENLVELFEVDKEYDSNIEIKNKKETIFYEFLKEILFQKFSNQIFNHNKNDNIMKYIHHGDFINFDICNYIYDKIKIRSETILDKDMAMNSMMNMVYNLSVPFSPYNKPINPLILMFFTQVYVFYQNKYSPLLKYAIPSEKNLATIPFVLDLRGACIEGRFTNAVLSPLMVQDFYSKIFLKQNNFREMGMFELGKICVFNNNIKHIECETCLLKSSYLDFLIYAMGLYDNYSVKEINFSYNYIKEFGVEFIIKIIIRFKELKTLNISSNDMKSGIGNLFVVLKNLYRTKKTKIENLILNKCMLDESSFYELGELVKCKYCGLKTVVLNNNSFQLYTKFLKKLKKNKNMTEIYLNKTELNNTHVDNIVRIMSNTNTKYLYLYKNKMNNFNDFLRILYRTKIVKTKKEINEKHIIINESVNLINLDLSNNDYPIKNHLQIKLLKNILKETSLYCLDICHILYGLNPDKWKGTQDSLEYKKNVIDIKTDLEEIKNKYVTLIKKIRENSVDVVQNKKHEEEKLLQKYNKKEIIDKILQDKNSMYSAFLKIQAEKILREDKEVVKDDVEKFEESVDKLMNFFILKRSEKTLDELQKEKYQKKLILV